MDRFRLLIISCLGLSAGASLVIACTTPAPVSNGITTKPDPKKKGGDDDTTSDDDTTADDDDVTTNPKPKADPPLPDGGKPPGRIYAHTATALYLFDPLVQTLKKVGDFTGFDPDLPAAERMLDIALDRDSAMYGTTDYGFVRIDPTTAAVSYIKKNLTTSFTFPNALSFVPIGTVDNTKEALVGYLQKTGANAPTTYVRVDLTTGSVTEIGDLNPPGATTLWRSAGDIIATDRGGVHAYLTVQSIDADGGAVTDETTDSLAEVDAKTGAIKKIIGKIGQPDFYGLGAWAGTSYGFNNGGNIVQIDLTTGAGKTLLTLKEDGGATGSWFGAGMTTDAPTAP